MLQRGLGVATVSVVLVASGALSWSAGHWWLAGGHAPLRVGWLTGLLLLAMGGIVLVTGSRMWRMRRGRTHVEPLVAARILGLAQASAVTGAIIAGLYLGQALALLRAVDRLADHRPGIRYAPWKRVRTHRRPRRSPARSGLRPPSWTRRPRR